MSFTPGNVIQQLASASASEQAKLAGARAELIEKRQRDIELCLARLAETEDGKTFLQWLRSAYIDRSTYITDGDKSIEQIALAAAARDAEARLVRLVLTMAAAGSKPR